jgi:ABC-type spermidine/putrescine transport system permease subunit I
VMGGGNVVTVTLLMSQDMLTTLDWPRGAARSMLLLMLVSAFLALYRLALRRRQGGL